VAIGALAMLGQVVLLRELDVAFFGSELILVLALGAWLLGTAAGAGAPGALAGGGSGGRRHAPGELAVRRLFVGYGLALPLAVALARGSRVLFRGVPGADLPFDRQMLALALCVIPVSLLLGLLFQWTARRYAAAGGTLATAYALESLGGLAGGLLATLLPAIGVQNWTAAVVCGSLAFAAAWRGSGASRESAAAGLFLMFALLAAAPWFDRGMTAWNHPALAATRDTPYGRITVTETLGQSAVFENDALAYESQGTAAEEFVRLAAIQREAPRRVLVLGGAAQGLVAEALRDPSARVDDVELDPALLALVRAHLPESERRALQDPRARVIAADPRRVLERAGRYDLILAAMPEPESGRTNRYYTREFFAACAARLAPDGVLALRLKSAENLWTPVLARRAGAVHAALRTVFPATVVLPGTTNLFLASRAPLERDPALLGERLRRSGVPTRLVSPAYVRYLYTNDRFGRIADLLAHSTARPNLDARPVCYQTTMLLGLARFFPRLARLDLPEPDAAALARSPRTWAAAVALALLLALARGHHRAQRDGPRRDGPGTARRALLAGLAGASGMLLEAALLLEYQTRSGVLFQDLGVLLTAFMAGLAAGAWVLGRLLARGAPSHPRAPSRGARWSRSGALTFVLLAALALLCAARLRGGAGVGLAESVALLFACGFLVAAAFAWAVSHDAPDAQAVLGPVYAADLLGGCAGSLLAGILAIPMLGLPATAALGGIAALAGLALV
ncbi:MAG TPA: hypothetical protein VMS88_04890, partial [Terriglobales bacterium]|nr:hypothetical protein [Terriglobales bacterium]